MQQQGETRRWQTNGPLTVVGIYTTAQHGMYWHIRLGFASGSAQGIVTYSQAVQLYGFNDLLMYTFEIDLYINSIWQGHVHVLLDLYL